MCWARGGEGTDTHADTDADTDADAGTDTDAGTDADTDAGPDTDAGTCATCAECCFQPLLTRGTTPSAPPMQHERSWHDASGRAQHPASRRRALQQQQSRADRS